MSPSTVVREGAVILTASTTAPPECYVLTRCDCGPCTAHGAHYTFWRRKDDSHICGLCDTGPES